MKPGYRMMKQQEKTVEPASSNDNVKVVNKPEDKRDSLDDFRKTCGRFLDD
jgi:hypothetical protein